MSTRKTSVRNAILCTALVAFSGSIFAASPGWGGGGIPLPGPNVAASPGWGGGGIPLPGPNVA